MFWSKNLKNVRISNKIMKLFKERVNSEYASSLLLSIIEVFYLCSPWIQ